MCVCGTKKMCMYFCALNVDMLPHKGNRVCVCVCVCLCVCVSLGVLCARVVVCD